jgi:hypothetical protein
MDFRNTTALSTEHLRGLLLDHTRPYRHDRLRVLVRYGRGADFSGRCYYKEGRIHVNLGRHVRYPYLLATNVAKARSYGAYWRRDVYRLKLTDAYQLVLFIYLHELFHYLVHAARRAPRRKEAMCDRFAARALVDRCGCPLLDRSGFAAPRERWDFQDLDAFVAAAPRLPVTLFDLDPPVAARKPPRKQPRRRKIPVRILGE